ncbi:zinc ribbon domain-containing protein [Chloracidobacterium thermophilum]|uniref:zinc ribbon domain-containing protein n=1 Tax=Chloracidobacterium thermophilum TaxID=458033 RepID=UPI001BB2D88C|nr:zinc ribbon domain-containing protein [Chloracidobacterium thermophilum]
MIRCPQCGTDNLDGSEYCDECGYQLSAMRGVPTSGALLQGGTPSAPLRHPPQSLHGARFLMEWYPRPVPDRPRLVYLRLIFRRHRRMSLQLP